MMFALARRPYAKILVNHHVITWVVKHATDILNKFAEGTNERTAFQRIRGNKEHGEMVECSREVMYKLLCKLEGGLMVDRWVLGIWFGTRDLSDEHVVAMCACLRLYVCCLIGKAGTSSSSTRSSETLLNPKGAGQADRGEVEVEVIPVDRTLVLGQTEQPMDQRPE